MKGVSSSGQYSSAGSPPLSGDDRKRRRMQSNRESARRSRIKKQKRLEDLTAEIARISEENDRMSNGIDASAQQYAKVEAQNTVLRTQMMELSQRLQSLDEILSRATTITTAAAVASSGGCMSGVDEFQFGEGLLNNSWNVQLQPIMAAAENEMFDYY